jgi:hypothetical protein
MLSVLGVRRVAKIQGTEDYSPVLRTVEFRNSRTGLEVQGELLKMGFLISGATMTI